jgi:hypothetical protein
MENPVQKSIHVTNALTMPNVWVVDNMVKNGVDVRMGMKAMLK